MYMYYLLGHRLVGQPLPDVRRKQTIADNTFILALDGDVDFKPSAVQLLVDRMKKNDKVGAACGRIHPIGTGQNHSSSHRLVYKESPVESFSSIQVIDLEKKDWLNK